MRDCCDQASSDETSAYFIRAFRFLAAFYAIARIQLCGAPWEKREKGDPRNRFRVFRSLRGRRSPPVPLAISHTRGGSARDPFRDCSAGGLFHSAERKSACPYLKYRIACVSHQGRTFLLFTGHPRTMHEHTFPPTWRISPGETRRVALSLCFSALSG